MSCDYTELTLANSEHEYSLKVAVSEFGIKITRIVFLQRYDCRAVKNLSSVWVQEFCSSPTPFFQILIHPVLLVTGAC